MLSCPISGGKVANWLSRRRNSRKLLNCPISGGNVALFAALAWASSRLVLRSRRLALVGAMLIVAAYGALVERYKAAVLKLAFRILRHAGDAEDAAQDAFVRAYVALDTYNPQFRFYTWIAAITPLPAAGS